MAALVDPASEQAQTELLDAWRANPVAYIEQALGWRPTPWQADILVDCAEPGITAAKSGHGIGKSAIAAAFVQWGASVFRSCAAVTTAPVSRQVKEVIWREIISQQARAPIPLGAHLNKTDFEIDAETYAFGFSTDDPNRFQGVHGVGSKEWGISADDPNRPVVLIVADESAGISAEIMDALVAIMTGPLDRMLLLGNATDGQSRFASHFADGSKTRQHTVSSLMVADFAEKHGIPGLVSHRGIDELREAWGEGSVLWQGRVLGEFPTDSEDSCIQPAWVEAAFERWRELLAAGVDPKAGVLRAANRALGLDVARGKGKRSGRARDQTVWTQRADDAVWIALERRELGPTGLMAVVGETCRLADEAQATMIAVDDTGLGGGVTDRLIEQGRKVMAVNFGAAPRRLEKLPDGKNRFANRRTEIWWHLREALRSGVLVLEPHERLRGDLTAPRYDVRSNGQIILEPKEDTIKRLGRSPDGGDSVALAWDAGVSTGKGVVVPAVTVRRRWV